MVKEETITEQSLYFISQESKALTMLSCIILEMQMEFLQFKIKNPDNSRIAIQEKRYELITKYIDLLNTLVTGSIYTQNEINQLRWSLTNQTHSLKSIEDQLIEAKEKNERLEKEMNRLKENI